MREYTTIKTLHITEQHLITKVDNSLLTIYANSMTSQASSPELVLYTVLELSIGIGSEIHSLLPDFVFAGT